VLDWRQGMSNKTLMSVDEYLHATFDGADREYLDGEIVERNMGNDAHSAVQVELIYCFRLQQDRTGLYVRSELRHRVAENRFRIPDVAVFEGKPPGQVPSAPPLVAIEILSPDDRIGYVIPKLEEYRQWGVGHIWIVDPDDRKLFTYGENGLHEVIELRLPEYGITLSLAEIFGAA
jgi:Uma2 family endonuclease